MDVEFSYWVWQSEGLGSNSYAVIGLKEKTPLVDAVSPSGWVTNVNNISQPEPVDGYQLGLFGNAMGIIRAQMTVGHDDEEGTGCSRRAFG
eukprot:11485750-Prorocentrum_lima.AAC.1